MKNLLTEEKIRMRRLAGIINESEEISEINLLNEDVENIEDFFNFLERDPKRGSFAYVCYTYPMKTKKTFFDMNGEKKPNPYNGKLFKNSRFKFSYGQFFKEVIAKKHPEYVGGERKGKFEKITGYDVLESGKSGLYLPIIPLEEKKNYSVMENEGQYKLINLDDYRLYLPDRKFSTGGSPEEYRQLILDRIYKISAGGAKWINPNFKYEYLGPGAE